MRSRLPYGARPLFPSLEVKPVGSLVVWGVHPTRAEGNSDHRSRRPASPRGRLLFVQGFSGETIQVRVRDCGKEALPIKFVVQYVQNAH